MKVSEEFIRIRSRADEKARLISYAKSQGTTLSVVVRRALRDRLDGNTTGRHRQANARIRMALNKLAALANSSEAANIAAEAKALLGDSRR